MTQRNHAQPVISSELIFQDAVEQVRNFCVQRMEPVPHGNQLVVQTLGSSITIVSVLPAQRPFAPPVGIMKIAQLRYQPEAGAWSLWWQRKTERWAPYSPNTLSTDVTELLHAIAADVDGCFWG